MKTVRADLHVHTCLSPCADDGMRAAAIVERAGQAGLDMIAICDHNSAENVGAVVKAARGRGLAVIPGIEITSSEEVHILGLFSTELEAARVQQIIYENLPGENSQEAFGAQLVVDERDRVVGRNSRLLIGATTLTVEQVVDAIHRCEGLAIASHIDRERFSIIGQLGLIPQGLELDAVEVRGSWAGAEAYGYPVVMSSDAHFLDEIGRRQSCFFVEDACIGEIARALRRELGRRVLSN